MERRRPDSVLYIHFMYVAKEIISKKICRTSDPRLYSELVCNKATFLPWITNQFWFREVKLLFGNINIYLLASLVETARSGEQKGGGACRPLSQPPYFRGTDSANNGFYSHILFVSIRYEWGDWNEPLEERSSPVALASISPEKKNLFSKIILFDHYHVTL